MRNRTDSGIANCQIRAGLAFHILLALIAVNYSACVLQTSLCRSSCFQCVCVTKVGPNPFSILHIAREEVSKWWGQFGA